MPSLIPYPRLCKRLCCRISNGIDPWSDFSLLYALSRFDLRVDLGWNLFSNRLCEVRHAVEFPEYILDVILP